MNNIRFQKQTALAVSLICLFWAGYMMVPVGHHLMEHGKKGGHAAKHSSVACAWLCGSSSVTTPDGDYSVVITRIFIQPLTLPNETIKTSSIAPGRIPRPPPRNTFLSA